MATCAYFVRNWLQSDQHLLKITENTTKNAIENIKTQTESKQVAPKFETKALLTLYHAISSFNSISSHYPNNLIVAPERDKVASWTSRQAVSLVIIINER
jgi:hypothetical protein